MEVLLPFFNNPARSEGVRCQDGAGTAVVEDAEPLRPFLSAFRTSFDNTSLVFWLARNYTVVLPCGVAMVPSAFATVLTENMVSRRSS